MSFQVSIQDYSKHKFGDPRPAVVREYFRSQAEAEAALRTYRTTHPEQNIYVACVAETKPRKPPVVARQADFGFNPADGPRRTT
jgi:hypothetical protein